ncbi:hypothetical protein [Luteimonas notoginsengisoli]|uniref:Uncharacterized protein n=1 Tax=Luteimonas notoginsengisoli TaxID=1578200 RepID=A0ABV7UQU2_9GAMM
MKTQHKAGTIEALAEVIAARVKGAKPARPILRVVTTPRPTLFDSITRDCIYRRIRWLRKAYSLQFLIDQATFNHPGIESLEDACLSKLLRDMETARECLAEGIPLSDMDIVTDTSAMLTADWGGHD